MTNGLKVYYIPIQIFYNQSILPTMIGNIPLLRYILLREQIQIVHGHSAFSSLAHETMHVGSFLGLKTVFTDHSLFGFADLSAIVTNKLLEILLSNCNQCICVSHTGKLLLMSFLHSTPSTPTYQAMLNESMGFFIRLQ